MTDFDENLHAASFQTSICACKFSARSQRPKAKRSQGQRPNFQKISRSHFNHNLGHLQRFHINFCPKTPYCRRFGFRAQGVWVRLHFSLQKLGERPFWGTRSAHEYGIFLFHLSDLTQAHRASFINCAKLI